MVNILYLMFLTVSCSVVQKQAVSQMSQMMLKGSKDLTRESSLSFFKESTAANLKMIEGFYYVKPNDLSLLTLLIKGHSGYAYANFDTKYLKDKILDKEYSYSKMRASEHYTKAMDFGRKYLSLKGLSFESLKKKDAAKKFDDYFDLDDVTAVFYFAQSWGQLINYNRDNLDLVGEIIYVENLLNWACSKDPYFEEGLCDLYKAIFEAQKPRLMGGDPKLAKELFNKAMKRYPKNLMVRMSYIEFLLIPTLADVEYYKQKKLLQKEFFQWRKVLDYSQRKTTKLKYEWDDLNNLYNALAYERFLIIKKLEKEIF